MDKLTYAYINWIHFIQVSEERVFKSCTKSHINLLVYEIALWFSRYPSSCGRMVGQVEWTIREACWFWRTLHFRFKKPALVCESGKEKMFSWAALPHCLCATATECATDPTSPLVPQHTQSTHTLGKGAVDYLEFCLFIVFFNER